MGVNAHHAVTPAEIAAHRKAQAKYQKAPLQVKKRESRNKVRAKFARVGKVHKGDHKDVDHHSGNALDDRNANLRVLSEHHNRAYARDHGAHKVRPGVS